MPSMNAEGLALLKDFEKCRLQAYLDCAGVATIGWGTTGPDIHLGMIWTQDRADARLSQKLDTVIAAVERSIAQPMNDNEKSAFAVIAYNIGEGAFASSSMTRFFNKGDKTATARSFLLWDKARVNGQLVALPGLQRRRAAEMALFLKSTEHDGIPEESGVTVVAPPPALSSSLTMKGAGTAIIGGVTTIGTMAPEIAPQIQDAHDTLYSLGFDVKWLAVAAGVLVVIGATAAIVGRLRNRSAGAI